MKLRLFVDFWNFQLNFQQRSNGQNCDWTKVSTTLLNETNNLFSSNGLPPGSIHEVRVYASYELGRESKLKNWLESWLDKQPAFTVISKERHWRQKSIHCRECGNEIANCPKCNKPLGRAAEKMVDSRIVTDMLSLAWDGSYDAAILLTSDADIVPAVENLQRRNFKVINATWDGHGHELQKTCWASFTLDSLISKMAKAPQSNGARVKKT